MRGQKRKYTYGDYMKEKTAKLRSQCTVERISTIFEKVYIYVNGFTLPSKEELRDMIIAHGGNFEAYLSPRVTHVIASNLPATKVREYRKKRSPRPILKPEWIVDSIRASRQLPNANYILDCLRDPTQARICTNVVIPETPPTKKKMPNNNSAVVTASGGGSSNVEGGPTQNWASIIKTYFEKSRLSHIGSWRTHFQARADLHSKENECSNNFSSMKSSSSASSRVILHVDMDCFFVSVAVRNKPPEFSENPIAVAHSSTKGYSEISSCNYVARDFGLRAGMMMKEAKALCPDLVVLDYDFDAIKEVSEKIYDIFFRFASVVQAVSCDEAYLQLPASDSDIGMSTALLIRKEILKQTKCPSSVGISSNIILARLATKRAKPNGQFEIKACRAAEFLQELPVTDLPGVGYKVATKIHALGITTCGELVQDIPKSVLQSTVGQKLGHDLFLYAQGIDNRELKVELERKSISVEMNYAIRFVNEVDAIVFITELAKVFCSRVIEAQNIGGFQHLMLKIKKRKTKKTSKYLGCGWCDTFTASKDVVIKVNDGEICEKSIASECIALMKQLKIEYVDMRGIGIHANKLLTQHPLSSNSTSNSTIKSSKLMTSWLHSSTKSSSSSSHRPFGKNRAAAVVSSPEYNIPRYSQIDPAVLKALPLDMQQEITNHNKTLVRNVPGNNNTPRHSPVNDNAIRFSQIDADVYNALPPTLRKEILRDCQGYDEKKEVCVADEEVVEVVVPRVRMSQVDPEVFDILPTPERHDLLCPSQLNNVNDCTRLVELTKELESIMKGGRNKLEKNEVQKIVSELRIAISKRQLDKVELFLRSFRRKCLKYGWEDCFNTVLQRSNAALCDFFQRKTSFGAIEEIIIY